MVVDISPSGTASFRGQGDCVGQGLPIFCSIIENCAEGGLNFKSLALIATGPSFGLDAIGVICS